MKCRTGVRSPGDWTCSWEYVISTALHISCASTRYTLKLLLVVKFPLEIVGRLTPCDHRVTKHGRVVSLMDATQAERVNLKEIT